MIVECTNCDTRFQLDDARVPVRGIRVRCSRCKEAFFLEHPDASKQDAAHDVAEQAAVGAPPDATQDLPTTVTDRASPDPEEEDWEFNADFPGEDPNEASGSAPAEDADSFDELDDDEIDTDVGEGDVDAADVAPDAVPGLGVDDLSVDEEDASSGLDLADSSETRVSSHDFEESDPDLDEADVDDALADLGAEGDASDFGEATDFSALAEEPAPAAAPVAAPAPAAAAAASSQDVGESEDWDFFSDESLEQPGLDSMDNAMGRVMEVVEDPSRLRGPGREPELGSAPPQSGSGMAGLRAAGRTVGWIVTCCLFGIGVARGVFGVAGPGAHALTSADLGPFAAQQVKGTWYETIRSTRLYAVTGQLVNHSSDARVPGDALRVTLTSPSGIPLEHPGASASVLIAEADLRELSAADLDRVRSYHAFQLAQTRVEPGQSVPFLAFFDGVPAEASGFVLAMDAVPAPLPTQPVPVAMEVPLDEAAGIGLGYDEGTGEAAAGENPEMAPAPATIPTSAVPAQASPQPLRR